MAASSQTSLDDPKQLWGSNHFESGKHLARYQYGVRGGILIGDGLESEFSA